MTQSEAIEILKKVNPDLEDTDLNLHPEDRPKIREWVAALRSGEYSQTDGQLYSAGSDDDDHEYIPEGYCCLGVYCRKVLGIAGDMKKPNNDSAEFPSDIGANMPISAAVQRSLAELNDGHTLSFSRRIKMNFEEIANLVEAVYLA